MNWFPADHPLARVRFQAVARAPLTWRAVGWPVPVQVWQPGGRYRQTAWVCEYDGHYGHGRTAGEATNRAMRRAKVML